VVRIEKRLLAHDEQLSVVFDALRQLMVDPEPAPRPRIGYATEQKE
jgi:hypothetical protein